MSIPSSLTSLANYATFVSGKNSHSLYSGKNSSDAVAAVNYSVNIMASGTSFIYTTIVGGTSSKASGYGTISGGYGNVVNINKTTIKREVLIEIMCKPKKIYNPNNNFGIRGYNVDIVGEFNNIAIGHYSLICDGQNNITIR